MAAQDCSIVSVHRTAPFTLPEKSTVNWSHIMAPVRDQLKCNCCWAIVAADIITSYWKNEKGEEIINSAQQLIDCVKHFEGKEGQCRRKGYTCSVNRAFKWIITKGISKDEHYPFVAAWGVCKPEIERILRIRSFERISDEDESQEKLCTEVIKHPVAAAIHMYDWIEELKEAIYTGPISTVTSLTGYRGVHAVQIVGFGREEGKEVWHVLSSWGSGWGVNGIGKVDRSVVLEFSGGKRSPLVCRASFPILV